MLKEMLFKAVHSLLWPIVPARIDPFLSVMVLPQSEYLTYDWLCKVIGIANMDPIACAMLIKAVSTKGAWLLTDSPDTPILFNLGDGQSAILISELVVWL